MNGLAQAMAQGAQQGLPTVEEVAAMLAQGADSRELVQAGIPQELVMQAIQMLEQAMAAEQTQVPVQEPGQGLARMQAIGQV